MRGRLFDDFFGYLVKAWQPTTSQLNWVLFPGDPRDAESELVECIL